MSTLAIAQYTRAMISEPRSDVEASRCRAQRLCMILTTAAMVPIATVVITICQRESLGISATAFIAGTVVISGMLRQVTAIEIWMAKVVHNPGPALRIGLVVEAARIGAFSLIAYLASSLYASVAALVICDAVLLLAMLRQSRKSRIDA